MTPTLYGRWQTRLLLLGSIGVIVTVFFGYLYKDYLTTFSLLSYIVIFGFIWDSLYQYIQSFRWDRDWPPAFQFAAGVAEGLFLWLLTRFVDLPGVTGDLTWGRYLVHYAAVWLITFLASQSLLRLVYPRWRFRGGQWL